MLNVGQTIKIMDIDLKTILQLTFSVLFAIKMIMGEIAIINMFPKKGRVAVAIVYLLMSSFCIQVGSTFFAIAFLVFSIQSIVMAGLVDHMTRIEKAQFKAWQKYISDKIKDRKDTDS